MHRLLAAILCLSSAAQAADFILNNNVSDLPDETPGDGICDTGAMPGQPLCSLRAAIMETNALSGTDRIHVFDPDGGYRLNVIGSSLPAITGTLTIDGTNNGAFVGPPTLGVSCNNGTDRIAFEVGATVIIRGVVVEKCTTAIRVSTGKVSVFGSYIGTNSAGSAASPNGTGIRLSATTRTGGGSIIGGANAIDRNIISGNTIGIDINGDLGQNFIDNNYIGLNLAGTAAIANADGILVTNGGDGNHIGNTIGNVISGNTNYGVRIISDTSHSFLENNKIGTNAAGTAAIANGVGARFSGGTDHSIATNVISGNSQVGLILGSLSQGVIFANRIGTNAAGTAALPNPMGVNLESGCSTIFIGDGGAPNRNIISGNSQRGLSITGAGSALVNGNRFGHGVGGELLGNGSYGVFIDGGTHDSTFNNNVVSGSSVVGLVVSGGGANLVITSNSIGSSVTGGAGSGNGEGLFISNTSGATVNSNLIVTNTIGIDIDSANNNNFSGNLIGTDGTTAIANQLGVYITGSSTGNTISNGTISGNSNEGVLAFSTGTNSLFGNKIGTNSAGTAAVANERGVSLSSGSTSLSSNVISGNTDEGVFITGNGNFLLGNKIGTNAAGSGALPNDIGVYILDSSNNWVGSTIAGQGNLIAFNTKEGLFARGTNLYFRNSFVGNGTLGIDHSTGTSGDGPTADDTPDANGLQNNPVLLSAIVDGSQTLVRGTVNSVADSNITIELFTTTSCDASGYGEGETYQASHVTLTNSSGLVTFVAPMPTPLPQGTILTATATRLGTSEFSACVAVSGFCTAVSPSPTPTPLPAAVRGQSYSLTLGATGGTPPYSFALAGGSLPLGISTGANGLQGTPLNPTNASFTIKTSDAYGCSATRNYTLAVTCPPITLSPTTLPGGSGFLMYDQTVTSTGGADPVTFAVTSGSLPGGISSNGFGGLMGSPIPGDYSFTLTATDQYGCTGSQAYSITIGPPVDLATDPPDMAMPEGDLARFLPEPDLRPVQLPDLAGQTTTPDLSMTSTVPVTPASGCSCRVAPSGNERGPLFILALLGLWISRHAKRRRGTATRQPTQ